MGGESDREILMAPACVILRLGFGLRVELRRARGVPLGFVQVSVDEMVSKVVLRDREASLVSPVQVLMLSDVS